MSHIRPGAPPGVLGAQDSGAAAAARGTKRKGRSARKFTYGPGGLGLCRKGDVLVSINGRDVTGVLFEEVQEIVAECAGQACSLVFRSPRLHHGGEQVSDPVASWRVSGDGELRGFLKVRATKGLPKMRKWNNRYWVLRMPRPSTFVDGALTRYKHRQDAEKDDVGRATSHPKRVLPVEGFWSVRGSLKNPKRFELHTDDGIVHKLEAASEVEARVWIAKLMRAWQPLLPQDEPGADDGGSADGTAAAGAAVSVAEVELSATGSAGEADAGAAAGGAGDVAPEQPAPTPSPSPEAGRGAQPSPSPEASPRDVTGGDGDAGAVGQPGEQVGRPWGEVPFDVAPAEAKDLDDDEEEIDPSDPHAAKFAKAQRRAESEAAAHKAAAAEKRRATGTPRQPARARSTSTPTTVVHDGTPASISRAIAASRSFDERARLRELLRREKLEEQKRLREAEEAEEAERARKEEQLAAARRRRARKASQARAEAAKRAQLQKERAETDALRSLHLAKKAAVKAESARKQFAKAKAAYDAEESRLKELATWARDSHLRAQQLGCDIKDQLLEEVGSPVAITPDALREMAARGRFSDDETDGAATTPGSVATPGSLNTPPHRRLRSRRGTPASGKRRRAAGVDVVAVARARGAALMRSPLARSPTYPTPDGEEAEQGGAGDAAQEPSGGRNDGNAGGMPSSDDKATDGGAVAAAAEGEATSTPGDGHGSAVANTDGGEERRVLEMEDVEVLLRALHLPRDPLNPAAGSKLGLGLQLVETKQGVMIDAVERPDGGLSAELLAVPSESGRGRTRTRVRARAPPSSRGSVSGSSVHSGGRSHVSPSSHAHSSQLNEKDRPFGALAGGSWRDTPTGRGGSFRTASGEPGVRARRGRRRRGGASNASSATSVSGSRRGRSRSRSRSMGGSDRSLSPRAALVDSRAQDHRRVMAGDLLVSVDHLDVSEMNIREVAAALRKADIHNGVWLTLRRSTLRVEPHVEPSVEPWDEADVSDAADATEDGVRQHGGERAADEHRAPEAGAGPTGASKIPRLRAAAAKVRAGNALRGKRRGKKSSSRRQRRKEKRQAREAREAQAAAAEEHDSDAVHDNRDGGTYSPSAVLALLSESPTEASGWDAGGDTAGEASEAEAGARPAFPLDSAPSGDDSATGATHSPAASGAPTTPSTSEVRSKLEELAQLNSHLSGDSESDAAPRRRKSVPELVEEFEEKAAAAAEEAERASRASPASAEKEPAAVGAGGDAEKSAAEPDPPAVNVSSVAALFGGGKPRTAGAARGWAALRAQSRRIAAINAMLKQHQQMVSVRPDISLEEFRAEDRAKGGDKHSDWQDDADSEVPGAVASPPLAAADVGNLLAALQAVQQSGSPRAGNSAASPVGSSVGVASPSSLGVSPGLLGSAWGSSRALLIAAAAGADAEAAAEATAKTTTEATSESAPAPDSTGAQAAPPAAMKDPAAPEPQDGVGSAAAAAAAAAAPANGDAKRGSDAPAAPSGDADARGGAASGVDDDAGDRRDDAKLSAGADAASPRHVNGGAASADEGSAPSGPGDAGN